MKFLILAAALLAASVSGQSLDILKLQKDPSTLLKFDRPLVQQRRLLGHPLERSLIYGNSIEIPSYLRDEILDVNVLEFSEVVRHPLFGVYYNLPLFRQYWSYPMFQRYVCSVYFQRFWEIPAFRSYFVNPILFYKYVYPMVTLFKTTTDVTSSTSTYGDYLIGNRNFLPYNYVQQESNDFFLPSIYRNGVYENIFDRLYDQLNIQRQGRLNEIFTDVQITPEGIVKEQTVGQIVDPVTGESTFSLGDAKLVEERIVPVEHYPFRQYPTYNRVNPFVARLLQGYDFNRVLPFVNHI